MRPECNPGRCKYDTRASTIEMIMMLVVLLARALPIIDG